MGVYINIPDQCFNSNGLSHAGFAPWMRSPLGETRVRGIQCRVSPLGERMLANLLPLSDLHISHWERVYPVTPCTASKLAQFREEWHILCGLVADGAHRPHHPKGTEEMHIDE